MQWLTARVRHTWRVYRSWLMAIALGLWGLLGAASQIRDNFLPPRLRTQLDTFALLPHWTGTTWAFIVLGILLLGAIEGSYRVDRDRQRELAAVQQQLAALLDLAPAVLSARVLPLRERRVADIGEFDVLVEVLVKEETAFRDEWRLDLAWESGARALGVPGRMPAHSYAFGRHVVRIAFPYAALGQAAIDTARIERLAGIDHRGRHLAYTPPAAVATAVG